MAYCSNFLLKLLFLIFVVEKCSCDVNSCFRDMNDAQFAEAIQHQPFITFLIAAGSVTWEKVARAPEFYEGLSKAPSAKQMIEAKMGCKEKLIQGGDLVAALAVDDAVVERTVRDPEFMKKLFQTSKLRLGHTEITTILQKEKYYDYLADCKICLIDMSKNEELFSKLAANEDAINTMADNEEFVNAIAESPEIKKKFQEKMNDVDMIREYIKSHKPEELSQILFNFKPQFKTPVQMLFVIPVICTWIGTIIVIIIMWSACYPCGMFPPQPKGKKDDKKKDKKKNSD